MSISYPWTAFLGTVIVALGLGWSTPGQAQLGDLIGLLADDEQVAALGDKTFEQIKQQEKISNDRQAQQRIQTIGRRIVDASDSEIPVEDWEFIVFENDQINAFALPGGHVGVYTGLIDIAESDDQLAAVIAHEIAHVTEDHVQQRIGTSTATDIGASVLAGVLGGDSPMTQQIANALIGAGAEFGVARPFGRTQESEADTVGLRYMVEAGYDPHAAVEFWQNMMQAKSVQGGLPAWLSTHPADQARIDALKAEIQEMG